MCAPWAVWRAVSKGSTLRDEGDYIVGCEVVNGDETVLVVCENGFGKRSFVDEFRQTNRGGVGVRSIITSERNGNVVGALCVTDNDGMVMISSSGQTVRISMRDLRVMGRNTQGVKLANLKEDDSLVAIQKITESAEENGEKAAEGTNAVPPANEIPASGEEQNLQDPQDLEESNVSHEE